VKWVLPLHRHGLRPEERSHVQAASRFDFDAFKRACESQDIEAWTAFYAKDAEWIAYRHDAPPRAPSRVAGARQIGEFLRRVRATKVRLSIRDEVLGPTRAAFCVTCTLPSGDRVIENVIIHHRDGKIARQVDVEAWD